MTPVPATHRPSLASRLLAAVRGSEQPAELWRYAAAVAWVAVASLVAELLYRALHTTRLSMVFLAGVLLAAVTQGARPGLVAAGLSFVIYDFYLAEPRFQLLLATPEDVLVLVVFLSVALLTGALAGRVRDEARRAKARADTTAVLYDASRELSSTWDEAAIRTLLTAHMTAAAKAPAIVWSADGPQSPAPADAPPPSLLADTARFAEARGSTDRLEMTAAGWRMRPLRADAPELGVAAWRAAPSAPRTEEDDRLVNILVDLGAAAIIRARLGAARSEIEALARTEQLREALLSSISHDFRTPLAAILASASSLRDMFDDLDAATRHDLVATIQEEGERLNHFVANLLQMSRLEAGAIEAERQVVDVPEVIDRVAQRFARGRSAGRVHIRAPGAPLRAQGDELLLEHVLVNVVENGLRFSGPEAPVWIDAGRDLGGVRIEVLDEGSGAPEADLKLMFDKFYQGGGEGRRETPGVGLGLSIARGLLSAMHGAIEAANRVDARGLRVTITLPAAA